MPNRRRRRARNAAAPAPPQGAPPSRGPGDRVYPMDHASPLSRLYAASVDLTVLFVLFVILNAVTQGFFGNPPDSAWRDAFLFFGYFVLPTGIFGQTPGKFAAGIVVVDRDGRVPGVAAAIPREMIGKFASTVLLFIGFAWILYDSDRQGLHDKIAGTYAVRKTDSGVPGLLGRLFRRDRE